MLRGPARCGAVCGEVRGQQYVCSMVRGKSPQEGVEVRDLNGWGGVKGVLLATCSVAASSQLCGPRLSWRDRA